MRQFVAILMLCGAGLAHAQQDTRTPLEAYRGQSEFGPTICGLKLRMALAQGDRSGDADYPGCITEQKAETRKAYESAMKTVKKGAAKQALKEHYIAVISRLTGIAPATDEIRIHYTRRQNEAKAKTEELWTRFEMENE